MPKTNIELSIIIISYNTAAITKNCLLTIIKSLQNSPLTYEIIVVDNNSNDGSRQMLETFTRSNVKTFKLIQNKQNVGFAKANNQAAKEVKGTYILLLNSDTFVLDDAIIKLLAFYRQNENEIHFLGGKLYNQDRTPQASCGPFYSLPVVFAALFLKGDHWGLSRYSPDKTREVDWVSGACILTTKEYYEAVGGFDENIFMYMDEIDLLYRAKQKKYRVFFYPEARFIHLGSASSHGKTFPILQVYRGFIYFYRKHHHDRISLFLLRSMLQLKSLIAISIGKITNNRYLIETYEKAHQLFQMA